MEKITQQIPAQSTQDAALEPIGNEMRVLQDLEMVLVGGGNDGAVTW